MAQVEEPLLESAPLARQFALRSCRTDPETGETCSWYHGLWQYLRLMKLVTTPEHHAEFYRNALGQVASGSSAARVLVAGAADYSMLAHALAAFPERGAAADVTVTDLCDTPLVLSRWYAERAGCRISTLRCDILEYPEDRPFDVICTHSFLGRFPPPQRLELVEKLRRLLRPGGTVVTVKRIRPGGGEGRAGFTPEQAQAFRTKVLDAARALPESLRIDPLELARDAGIYASRRRTWPVRSREEIRELFERSGFKVDRLHCAPVVAGVRAQTSGPTALGGAEYAQIVATRRL